MLSGCAAGAIAELVQPRSIENKPKRTAATSVGKRIMRPWASHAARAEPMATATENMVRKTVTTPSLPPIWNETMGGNSDMTRAPVSQNQLVTSAPHHSRLSPRTYLISAPVEAKMLRLMARFGAPSPVGGILCGQSGDDSAEEDSEERSAFDQRVARRQFRARKMIGQDAVFDRAE